jgi:phage terminase large subunit
MTMARLQQAPSLSAGAPRRIVIPYTPREHFKGFHARTHRWGCIVAHRRAGKTVACINELIKRAITDRKERGRYAYIAPFYGQAKQVAWEYLKYFAAPIMVEEPRESDLSVKLLNDATIRLYGADNPNTLRGLYFDGVIMDEYADMKPSVWSEVIRPALTDRKGWAVFIGTPKGKNAFWEIWDHSSRAQDWFAVMLKASRTKILPDEELAAARQSMTEDQYAQEFECSFEAAIHGAVYGLPMRLALDAGRIGSVPYDAALPVHTAWDLGFDDSTAIWFWQITHGEIRLIDYYENNGQGTEHYCDVLKAKPYAINNGYGRHWVPHDAAHELMAAGGRSIVNQAWNAGVKMSVIPATSQQNSIEASRKTIERCWFDAEKCKAGIEALRQYQFEFDEDKKAFKSKPRHDWASHGSDAFEIIGQVWQNPSTEKPKPKPIFLEDMTADQLFWPKDRNKVRQERI